jgi:hypothetical protein
MFRPVRHLQGCPTKSSKGIKALQLHYQSFKTIKITYIIIISSSSSSSGGSSSSSIYTQITNAWILFKYFK